MPPRCGLFVFDFGNLRTALPHFARLLYVSIGFFVHTITFFNTPFYRMDAEGATRRNGLNVKDGARTHKKCPVRCSRPNRAAEQILGLDMYPVAILAQGKGKGNAEGEIKPGY